MKFSGKLALLMEPFLDGIFPGNKQKKSLFISRIARAISR